MRDTSIWICAQSTVQCRLDVNSHTASVRLICLAPEAWLFAVEAVHDFSVYPPDTVLTMPHIPFSNIPSPQVISLKREITRRSGLKWNTRKTRGRYVLIEVRVIATGMFLLSFRYFILSEVDGEVRFSTWPLFYKTIYMSNRPLQIA